MKIVTALLFLSATHAWKNPSPKTTTTITTTASNVVKGLATTTAATMGIAATAANAATTTTTVTTIPALKMEVDGPVLFNIIKDELNDQEKILFDVELVKNLFGPAFTFELPSTEFSNLKDLALQLLRGSASVIINGQTVGVQVVQSEQGALTVQLQQQYLPKIPFLGLGSNDVANNVPTLVAPVPIETVTETTTTTTTGTAVVEQAVSATTAAVTTTTTPPFWDVPLLDGALRLDIDIPFLFAIHKSITPLDVVGTTLAGIGGIYVFAFAFYNYANWQDEQQMAAKKAKAAAARKKAAAAAKAAAEKLELPEKKMMENTDKTNKNKDDSSEAAKEPKKGIFSRK